MIDAQQTLAQIGRGNLMACGARDFVVSQEDSKLWFRVLTGRTLTKIVIRLNTMDTYDVQLVKISQKTYETKVLETKTDIYAEQLGEVVYHMVNK